MHPELPLLIKRYFSNNSSEVKELLSVFPPRFATKKVFKPLLNGMIDEASP